MPLELIVLAFVLVAFVAIAARFMPRDAAGHRRLPRLVDESVGMYVLRRALGRPTEAASDRARAQTDADSIVPEDEIAYRIGVPGAPQPTVPTRFIVSKAPPQAHPIPPVVPITTRPVIGGRPQARKGAALPLQRRFAALGTLVAVLLVGFAALSLPRGPEEAVLSATGTPGATPASSALAVVPTPSPTDTAFATVAPLASASPPPSEPSPTSVTPAPAVLTPTATPRRTPPPTPRPTPPPTPKPTPTPTKAPTPPPTPPPTPAPTPVQPQAVIDTSPSPACGAAPLSVTFTGDDLAGSIGNTFSWEIDGAGAGSGQVLNHTFDTDGTYVVRLTVSNAAGTDSAQVTVNVPC